MPRSAPTHNPKPKAAAHRAPSTEDRRADWRWYGHWTWRRLRQRYRQEHPWCEDPYGVHAAEGRAVAARHVDHRVPRKERPDLARSLDNLMALCIPCHSRKSQDERRK